MILSFTSLVIGLSLTAIKIWHRQMFIQNAALQMKMAVNENLTKGLGLDFQMDTIGGQYMVLFIKYYHHLKACYLNFMQVCWLQMLPRR